MNTSDASFRETLSVGPTAGRAVEGWLDAAPHQHRAADDCACEFQKGDDVPRHAHENEQISYILSGALHFWLGEEVERELIVREGEVLVVPSNLLHRALALEDTLDVDVFNPPREDWLSGTDAYLRR